MRCGRCGRLCTRLVQAQGGAQDAAQEVLLIQDRGRTERVPLAEVLFFKAELKYITVRTASRSHILDASLSELEERYAAQFLRVHRNALVARRVQHRHGGGEVHAMGAVGVLHSTLDRGDGGEVVDGVHPDHRLAHRIGLGDIADDQRGTGGQVGL